MTYHRIRSIIPTKFYFNGQLIAHVAEMRDLGVLFVPKLTFGHHIDFAISKALSMLGFVKRMCFNFRNIDCLKSIYFAHIRSHLEFACIVWSPDYDVHINRIESVQKKMVLFALRRRYTGLRLDQMPSYTFRCNELGIRRLSLRRDDIAIMFVFDVMTHKIDCPYILERYNFSVTPRDFRYSSFFRLPFCRTNYISSEPINRMCRIFNSVSHVFDFNITRPAFKCAVVRNS